MALNAFRARVLTALSFLMLCSFLACAQSRSKEVTSAKASGPTIEAPPGVSVGEIGRGPLEGYVSGMDYVDRGGKTVEVQRIVKATPLKPEYATWLLVEVTLAVDRPDSSEWSLRAKEFQLRTSRGASVSTYDCLGIVAPSYKLEGEPWVQVSHVDGTKDLLRAGTDFSEAKWSGVRIVSTMYEEIGLPKQVRGRAPTGEVIKAYLAFPPNTPGSGTLTLSLAKR